MLRTAELYSFIKFAAKVYAESFSEKLYAANYYHMLSIHSNGRLIGSDSPFSQC